MSLVKKKQEKNQETIRKLSLQGDNKECMDCVVKGTPYVILDFGVFVCTFCSGIHRGYNFKAKGISMTNFEDKDVEFLETHGNKVAQSIWRAKWDPNKVQKPKSTDEKGIKDFIHKTYVQKMWYDASGAAAATPSKHEEVPVQPIETLIQNPPKVEVRSGKSTQPQQTTTQDIFSFEPVTQTKVQPTQAPKQSAGLDFDFFSTPSQSTQPTQPIQSSGGFANDDNWGFDQPQTKQPTQKASINVDDLFAGFGSTQPQTQSGWGQQQGGFGGQQTHGGQQNQGGWGQQNQSGFGGQQNQGWGQQSQQQGGFGQQNQGWNQPQQGGFGGQQTHGQQGGFGGQQNQGWGQQTQQGGWGGQQQNQGWNQQGGFGGQQSHGQQGWNQSQQGGFGGQPQGFGSQPQGWNQPPQARKLDSPPPVKDPFSNLSAFGSSTTTSKQPPSNNSSMMNNDNPFDF